MPLWIRCTGKCGITRWVRLSPWETAWGGCMGVPSVHYGELLERADGLTGLAFDIRTHDVGVLFLDPSEHVSAGDELRATGRVASVVVGDELLGRVVDTLGRPLDGGTPIRSRTYRPVEREAPGVVDRQPVREPMHTGIKVIDALLPLGRGQRELILGDRATGKTSLALDADPRPARHGRCLCLRRHRPAQDQCRPRSSRPRASTGVLAADSHRGGRCRFAAGPAVPGPLRRVHDRRVVHAPGPARAGRLRQPDQPRRRLPADRACCWDARRAAKPIRPTSSISTPGSWSGPRACTIGWAAAA